MLHWLSRGVGEFALEIIDISLETHGPRESQQVNERMSGCAPVQAIDKYRGKRFHVKSGRIYRMQIILLGKLPTGCCTRGALRRQGRRFSARCQIEGRIGDEEVQSITSPSVGDQEMDDLRPIRKVHAMRPESW